MKRFNFSLLASMATATALAFASGSASALNSVNSQLFPGAQLMTDSSAEMLVNCTPGAGCGSTTGDHTVDVGDRLVGIVTIQQLVQGAGIHPLGIGSPSDELTGVFDIVVTSVVDTGIPGNSRFQYTFGAVSSATFATDTGVIAPPANTAVEFWDDAAQNFNRGGSVAGGLTSADGGALFWRFGFTSAGDFWQSDAATNDINAIGALPQGQAGGTFNLGVHQIAGGIGPTLGTESCVNLRTFTPTTVNACGNGSLTSKDPASAFNAYDQTQIAINVIPEPGSLALLGIGIAALGFGVRRRNGVHGNA